MSKGESKEELAEKKGEQLFTMTKKVESSVEQREDEKNKQKKEQLFTPTKKEESNLERREDSSIEHTVKTMRTMMQDEAGANKCMKIVFFIICCVILIAITGMLIRVLWVMMTYQIPNNSPEFAAEMISMVGAFIAAFMKVIEIIASNLFNLKLPESIVSILTSKIEQQNKK